SVGEISVKTGNNARNGGKNSLNRLIRCVCGKKIGPDPRNFNQRVSLGRNDLLIRTFPRARWLHGGGSSLRDPYAPRQGWKPTMGCTRAQNEDVDELCKKVTSWMYSHPGERIRYERFKTR
ncbi:hypothetical protein U9Z83_08315, partial [Escherichia coli]